MNGKQVLKGGLFVLLALVLTASLASADFTDPEPLSSGFTYQGQLKSSATPYNGSCDFEFKLFDALEGGSQVGITQTTTADLKEGYFTVFLDFGPAAFTGEARWLEIWVRCPSTSEGAYQQLTPRQALTAAPYAWFAQQAASTPWGGIGDNGALELRVNGLRILRLEPHATSPNLVGGYSSNSVSPGVYGAVIGGGGVSEAANTISAHYGVIGGGVGNKASEWASNVGGGYNNTASGWASSVGGGQDNTASGFYSAVGGGWTNTASGQGSTVGGGWDNTASGSQSTVPGGRLNTAAGQFSLAAGYRAKANKTGCFVWGDSSSADIECNESNRWVARARGGVYFYTSSDLSKGSYILANDSGWNNVSNRELKENFNEIDFIQLLERISQYPITTWNFKSQDDPILHIGMMADEFNSLIDGLGGEDKDSINTMDAVGVALAAVQGLYAENQELRAELETLQQEQANLEARLDALEAGQTSGANAASIPLPWMMGVGLAAVAGVWVVRRPRGGAG